MANLKIPDWLKALFIVVATVGIAGITVNVTVNAIEDEPAREPAPPVVVTVNEAPNDGKPTETVEVPAPAVEAAKPTLESDLKDPPPEAPKAELEKVQDEIQERKKEAEPLPVAGASAGFVGCVTRFVSNQSSRGGVRPKYQVLHYTVSPNRPGWSDVNAVVALFDRPSFKASSHFVIDREGNCAYIVPIERNAWTQAAGNRLSVAYEIINSGREGSFMDTAGYAKLKSVMAEVERRTGIPTTAGNVSTGKSGAVQHKDGGLAWGGHVDITPFSKDQVIRIVNTRTSALSANDPKRYRLAVLTTGERRWAICLLEERRSAARNGGWSKIKPIHRARATGCKRALQRRNEELHRLGLTGKNSRSSRHRVIHEVV